MNKNYYWKLISIMFVTVFSFAFLACSGDDEEGNGSHQENRFLLIVNDSINSPYSLSLFDSEKESVQFINIDGDLNIESIDLLYDDGDGMFKSTFYENGLIKSISNQNASIFFSNHNGNKLDIAFVVDDEMTILKEIETDVIWEDYIIDNHTMHNKTRVGFGDGFNDFADGVEQFQRNYYEKNSQINVVVDFIHDNYEVIKAGISEKGKKIAEAFIKQAVHIVDDFLIDIGLDWQITSFAVGRAEDAWDIATSQFTKWDLLLDLLADYDLYVDWCADQWLKFFEWQDRREQEERLALAALDSGFGDLKVTLSWNFYADIDLYAYEPSDNWIYYKYKRSPSGGFLDVDNRNGGLGASENIYWEKPEEGNYYIYLDYYGASKLNNMKQSGICNVAVMYKGMGRQFSIPMTEGSQVLVAQINVPYGIFDGADYTRSDQDSGIKLNIQLRKEPK